MSLAHQCGSEWEGLTTTLRSDFQGPCPEKGYELQSGAMWPSLWFFWGSRTKADLIGKEITEEAGQSLRRRVLGAEVSGCHGDERKK